MSHTLYISVEKVPATTQGTTLLGISLTILAASSPLTGQLARPWLWQHLTWAVWGSSDGTSWTPLKPEQINPLTVPPGDGPATTTRWRNRLETAVAQIKNWPAGAPSETTTILLKNDGTTPGEHQYLALLNNIAAGPYPIPQNLNLSFFLEVSGLSAGVNQFLAAPSFTADGATVQPTTGSPNASPSSMWDVTGPGGAMKMLSWFSDLDKDKDLQSLWIAPVQAGNAPLVSDWTAHLYDLIGPYLDRPHVLLNSDKAQLKSLLPDQSKDWLIFRRWIVAALFDVITSGLAPSAGPNPTFAGWCSTLKAQLGDAFKNLPALDPTGQLPPRTFEAEIADLQRIVTAVTTGVTLFALIKTLYGTNIQSVPSRLLEPENDGALLSWLELQVAITYAKQIAGACAATPGNYDAISTGLCNTVISPYLTFRAVVPLEAGPPPIPAGTTIPATIQAITDMCVVGIQKDLSKALSVRAKGDDGSSWPVTTSAPPLVIPVMQLRSSEDLKAGADPLHAIRGVAILMRRQEATPMDWKCPNIVGDVDDATHPLLVASRLGYNQKLLTGFLLYDNGPIPCANLLHNYMQVDDRLRSEGRNEIDSVFTYAPYEGSDLQFYATPELEAGKSFEVLRFAISNAGAVPQALRDGYPAKLKLLRAKDRLPGAGKKKPSPLLQSLGYYRTVPVGAVETRDAKGMPVQDSAGLFPRIPLNVWPRSIETVVPKVGVGLHAPGDSVTAEPSTVLVVPQKSGDKNSALIGRRSFVFSLKLPSIEPLSWDRTVGYQKDATTRAEILDAAYNSLKLKKNPEITDPLIAQVGLGLYRWEGSSGSARWAAVPGKITFTIDSLRKSPSGPNSVQTFPIQISVDAGSGNDDGSVTAAILGPPKQVAAKLAEGEVYLLEATFQLDSSVSTIMQRYPTAVTGFQLLIEIASAKMPSPADLIDSLTVSPVSLNNIPDQKVSVWLKTTASSPWRNVHSAEFLRQSWYWTGRTQPQPLAAGDLADAFSRDLLPDYYPAPEPPQSSRVQDWAMVEFAERPWTDHVVLPAALRDSVFQWEQDMSLDPRATYLRFAPRVYSRYQGAFEGLAPQGVATIGNGGDDVWRPCFLRSRTQRLEMPRLKALIPLTESAFAPGTPGILAVFDGPAFEQAGLAERLQVQIAEVNDPNDPTPTGKKWQQQGPDFLMSKEMADPTQPVTLNLQAIGPIGHTLDSLYSSFPKFLSHSWIIRPVGPAVGNGQVAPPNSPNQGHDFSWWFANLEFQLRIDGPSSVFKDAHITSQKVVGSWIQFLPGFQDSQHQANHFDGWTLEWAKGVVTIRDSSGAAATRGNQKERHTRHYLLVTRTVRDVTGTRREAYVGVAAAAAAGTNWAFFPDTAKTLSPNFQLRGRFLDVRAGEIGASNQPPASDAEFWQRILGRRDDVENDEKRASIVSLSPVIRQKGSLQ